MKLLIALVSIAALAGGGLAVAKTSAHGVTRAPARGVAHVSYKPGTVKRARRPIHRYSRLALLARARHDQGELPLRQDEQAGPPDRPGLFKEPGKAGYGVSHGGAETMLGVYSRDPAPVMGGPDIYHREAKGAAGVSVSLKLGH